MEKLIIKVYVTSARGYKLQKTRGRERARRGGEIEFMRRKQSS